MVASGWAVVVDDDNDDVFDGSTWSSQSSLVAMAPELYKINDRQNAEREQHHHNNNSKKSSNGNYFILPILPN